MKPQDVSGNALDASEAKSVALGDVERAMLVRRLGSSLAHVLANSLNVIGMRSSMLALARDADAVARSSSEIVDHVARISALFDHIQRYADALEPAAELVDVDSEAQTALRSSEIDADYARKLDVRVGARRSIVLPRSVVAVVFSNLFGFAVRATPEGSRATCEISVERVVRGTSEIEVLRIKLALPAEVDVPRDRRTLLEPWLADEREPRRELIPLALGVGAVRDRGGWFELESEGPPVLTLFWPARGSHAG